MAMLVMKIYYITKMRCEWFYKRCPQKATSVHLYLINEPHLQLLADGIEGVPFVHESTQQVGDLNKNSGCKCCLMLHDSSIIHPLWLGVLISSLVDSLTC